MNSRAQNQALKKIDTKLDEVATQTTLTDPRLESFSVDVRKLYTVLQQNITRLDIELK